MVYTRLKLYAKNKIILINTEIETKKKEREKKKEENEKKRKRIVKSPFIGRVVSKLLESFPVKVRFFHSW